MLNDIVTLTQRYIEAASGGRYDEVSEILARDVLFKGPGTQMASNKDGHIAGIQPIFDREERAPARAVVMQNAGIANTQ